MTEPTLRPRFLGVIHGVLLLFALFNGFSLAWGLNSFVRNLSAGSSTPTTWIFVESIAVVILCIAGFLGIRERKPYGRVAAIINFALLSVGGIYGLVMTATATFNLRTKIFIVSIGTAILVFNVTAAIYLLTSSEVTLYFYPPDDREQLPPPPPETFEEQ